MTDTAIAPFHLSTQTFLVGRCSPYDLAMLFRNQREPFCFHFKLFSQDRENKFVTGFQDWVRAKELIERHGRSPSHHKSMADAVLRNKADRRVNRKLLELHLVEKKQDFF